jgi:hypothetical protein
MAGLIFVSAPLLISSWAVFTKLLTISLSFLLRLGCPNYKRLTKKVTIVLLHRPFQIVEPVMVAFQVGHFFIVCRILSLSNVLLFEFVKF